MNKVLAIAALSIATIASLWAAAPQQADLAGSISVTNVLAPGSNGNNGVTGVLPANPLRIGIIVADTNVFGAGKGMGYMSQISNDVQAIGFGTQIPVGGIYTNFTKPIYQGPLYFSFQTNGNIACTNVYHITDYNAAP